MPQRKRTLYDILGVANDAMPIDIGLAYEKRREELQGAGARDPGEAALLRQAHEVLSDPKRRAAYDASLVTESEKAAAREQAQEPDLVLDEEEGEPARRRIPPVGIAVGVLVILVIAFLLVHASRHETAPPPPAPLAEAPPPPPPPPQPMAARDIFAQAQKSVGRVQGFEMSGRAVPLGLAFAIDSGAMLTTCHGIPAGSQLVVSTGPEVRSASLLVDDESLDLCRLSVSAPLEPVALADHEVKPGDAVYALGANAQGELALTEGKVKSLMPDARGPMIELSMPVAPNGSGGPVFDAYGKLVGIATTNHGHGAAVSLAIPASWIARMRSHESAPATAPASGG
ncbi:MAG TPA: trypsin-like peptidase domain-containing protein [Usitatibacter sp.]|nr:trypsin-like peptidase domain-containing protein [Usitatibacter sp.]